ncbi:MAG: hypothetical protein ACLT2T_05425 [Bilophila wadsworthia]
MFSANEYLTRELGAPIYTFDTPTYPGKHADFAGTWRWTPRMASASGGNDNHLLPLALKCPRAAEETEHAEEKA